MIRADLAGRNTLGFEAKNLTAVAELRQCRGQIVNRSAPADYREFFENVSPAGRAHDAIYQRFKVAIGAAVVAENQPERATVPEGTASR